MKDRYLLILEIEAFCEKHLLPKRVCDNVLMLVEETLLLQDDFSDITINLAYSEKTSQLELRFGAKGVPLNPLAEGIHEDDIGLRLIRSRCASSQYTYENGRNIVFYMVKGE